MYRTYSILVAFLFVSATILQTSNEINDTQFKFIGTKACKKCHIKEYKSWIETKMAKAYDLLKPGERSDAKKKVGLDPQKDYTKDSECLPCHTTGYGQPGGFVNFEKTPQRLGVSCEACHGAGSEYTQEKYMHLKNKKYKLTDVVKVGLVSPVTSEMCTSSCHNEKSPFFNKNEPFEFEKRKNQGTHKHFPLKYNHN